MPLDPNDPFFEGTLRRIIQQEIGTLPALVRQLQGMGTVATSLPTNPKDGIEITYLADATNGVAWRLRYRPNASSAYDWLFIGGGQLTSEVATSESRAVNTYGALATAGPSVTVPLAGDYYVEFGFTGFNNTAGFAAASTVGSAGAPFDAECVRHVSAVANATSSVQRRLVKTGLVASTAVTMRYAPDGNTATFLDRHLAVWPRRVG